MKKCKKCNIIKETSNFSKNARKKDGLQTYCKECLKVYNHKHYLKNKDTYMANGKINKKKRSVWFENYKKTLKCEHCGFSHPAALQFHHTDPSSKLFNISSEVRYKSKREILDEIDKCIVLCANCHLILHYNER